MQYVETESTEVQDQLYIVQLELASSKFTIGPANWVINVPEEVLSEEVHDLMRRMFHLGITELSINAVVHVQDPETNAVTRVDTTGMDIYRTLGDLSSEEVERFIPNPYSMTPP